MYSCLETVPRLTHAVFERGDKLHPLARCEEEGGIDVVLSAGRRGGGGGVVFVSFHGIIAIGDGSRIGTHPDNSRYVSLRMRRDEVDDLVDCLACSVHYSLLIGHADMLNERCMVIVENPPCLLVMGSPWAYLLRHSRPWCCKSPRPTRWPPPRLRVGGGEGGRSKVTWQPRSVSLTLVCTIVSGLSTQLVAARTLCLTSTVYAAAHRCCGQGRVNAKARTLSK